MLALARRALDDKLCDRSRMDPKLAEIVRLLAHEPRGRGWRVPVQLKQRVTAWVHAQRASGVKVAQLAAASGLGAATLVRWAATTPTPTVHVPKVNALKPSPSKISAHNISTPNLPMRIVAVQADEATPRALRRPPPAPTYRALLVDGLDAAALLALTQRWHQADHDASTARAPC
jgi:hypothetical protein